MFTGTTVVVLTATFVALFQLTLMAEASCTTPVYVTEAQFLVDTFKNRSVGTNVYAGGTGVHITVDRNDLAASTAQTQCATFITNMLKFSYPTVVTNAFMTAWTGSTSPWAADYHDKIIAETGFTRIMKVSDLIPGDLVATHYHGSVSGVTGHIMLIMGATESAVPKSPIVAGTTQWEVDVIDSSSSFHGPTDTRSPPNTEGGIGRGIARFYSNTTTGELVGKTWSTYSNSQYYDVVTSSRTAVLGRPVHLLTSAEPANTYFTAKSLCTSGAATASPSTVLMSFVVVVLALLSVLV